MLGSSANKIIVQLHITFNMYALSNIFTVPRGPGLLHVVWWGSVNAPCNRGFRLSLRVPDTDDAQQMNKNIKTKYPNTPKVLLENNIFFV